MAHNGFTDVLTAQTIVEQMAKDWREHHVLERIEHVGKHLNGRSLVRPLPRWTTMFGPEFETDQIITGMRATGAAIDVIIGSRLLKIDGELPCGRWLVRRGTLFGATVRAHRRGHMRVTLEIFGYMVSEATLPAAYRICA